MLSLRDLASCCLPGNDWCQHGAAQTHLAMAQRNCVDATGMCRNCASGGSRRFRNRQFLGSCSMRFLSFGGFRKGMQEYPSSPAKNRLTENNDNCLSGFVVRGCMPGPSSMISKGPKMLKPGWSVG